MAITISTLEAKKALKFNTDAEKARAALERKLKKDEFLGEGSWMVAVIYKNRVSFELQSKGTIFPVGDITSVSDFFEPDGRRTKAAWEDPETGEQFPLEWVN